MSPSLNCDTCGASIQFDADEHSRLCPFCDSAVVADVKMQRHLVPQGLLPFTLQEQEAHDAMHSWLRARCDFDGVLVSGSKSVSAEFKDALAPWPLENLETYQTDFLAGFRAENYTAGLMESTKEVDEFIRVNIVDMIEAKIGGDKQKITHNDITLSNQRFKHLLLPVWITHYTLEGARYRMSVNGQTGKVYGQRPFSSKKLLAASLMAFLCFSALGVLVSTTFHP